MLEVELRAGTGEAMGCMSGAIVGEHAASGDAEWLNQATAAARTWVELASV